MIRQYVHDALDSAARTQAARRVRAAHGVIVLAGIAAVILSTDPAVMAVHGTALGAVITLVLALFLAEFAARLWVAPMRPRADPERPWRTRWRRLRSLSGVGGLLVILPIPVALALGLEPRQANLFGLIWIFELARYSPGLVLLGRVIRLEREPLFSVLFVFVVVLLVAATLIFEVETDVQPEQFGTLGDALWWTVVTLTTTGYGDKVPVSPLGRMLAGVVMVCGIAVFATWAGILANGFAQEVRRHEFLRTWDLVAHVPFFQNIGAALIAEIAYLLKPEDVTKGSVVLRRGDSGDCMYFIVTGEVEVQIEPKPLHLGPGTFFGEIALITGGVRTATAVATRPTTLLALDIADFRSLAARHPELTRAIQEEGARRLGASLGR